MKIRIAYFESKSGDNDVAGSYDVELNDDETIVSVEQLLDGGYNTCWHRVYILVPE